MKAAVYDTNGGPEVFRLRRRARAGGAPRWTGDRGEGDRHPGRRPDQPARGRAGHRSRTSSATRRAASSARSATASRGSPSGERVVAMMMNGSHAELASVAARKTWAIPDALSFEDAAAVPVEFGTADDCLFEFGRLQAGETVLIQAGSGGVGRAGDPAGQGRRRDRPLHRRSPTGGWSAWPTTASTTASTTRRPGRAGRGDAADRRARAPTSSSTPIGGRTLEGSIAALAYRGRISWMGNAGGATRAAEHLAADGEERARSTCVLRHGAVAATASGPTTLIAGLIERVGARRAARGRRPHLPARRRRRGPPLRRAGRRLRPHRDDPLTPVGPRDRRRQPMSCAGEG